MKLFRSVLFSFLVLFSSVSLNAQCKQTMSVNSYSAECNGDGTSTVTINISVAFGNGNNSVVISYNLDPGTGSPDDIEINAVVIEDDGGDFANVTYMFDVPTCDNYAVTLTAWTNPSGSGSSCTDPPPIVSSIVLPVDFGYFDISKNGDEIILRWSTLSEINNEKFVVQRSDASSEYEYLGEIKGAVNSLEEVHYQFVDSNFKNGTYYYRLKQIDLDGHFTFSDVRSVRINKRSNILAFPNPAKDYISFTGLSSETYTVMNVYGKVVSTISASNSQNKFDISDLDSGLYFVRSSTSNDVVSFIKI